MFQVWAAVPPWKQGSLAEYLTLTEYEVRGFKRYTIYSSHPAALYWSVSLTPGTLEVFEFILACTLMEPMMNLLTIHY